MSKLFFIPVKGPAEEISADLYGPLEFGAPSLEFLRRGLHCSTIEHLSVVFQGKPAHLFFDENGLFTSALPNDRAAAIAGNRRLRGPRLSRFQYNDLSAEPPPSLATLLATDMMIVGAAYLWTGDME